MDEPRRIRGGHPDLGEQDSGELVVRVGVDGAAGAAVPGYRRYGSAELLRLVQVRTQAGAGVPLAEIGDLLDAGPEQFGAALVPARALLPELFDSVLARLRHSLDDPECVALTKRGSDAASWDPDDPRIEVPASALAETNRRAAGIDIPHQ